MLGDTQRTTGLEVLLLRREQNEFARRALIEQLAREERPRFVIHLGDLVSAGASAREWRYFDALVAPLTSRGIEIWPILGNHDYWGPRALALRHVRERFPELSPRTYRSARHTNLGFVFLDSNLRGSEARAQIDWLDPTLQAFDADPETRGVLVFAHHPPFTNAQAGPLLVSRPFSPARDAYVHDQILPAFFRSRKALALLSGHIHGYERFVVRGKTFVVSGGAGGPRVSYATASAGRHAAAYTPVGAGPRAFHYLTVAREARQLRFSVKCLKSSAPERRTPEQCAPLETFCLPLAELP
ncbi:MAG TPA: metallophosphoesterase [Polyangiaceae bacterium]|nr:metallophosphoesterase [Polyangiaceae bacterium]